MMPIWYFFSRSEQKIPGRFDRGSQKFCTVIMIYRWRDMIYGKPYDIFAMQI